MTTHPASGSPPALSAGEIITPLILDLLEWLAPEPRPYVEVMDVWRTSCPRLSIWEEAVDLGLLVRRAAADGGPAVVDLTPLGRRALAEHGRRAAA